MRQFRTLAAGIVIAVLLAGCGAQNGQSTAENQALSLIPGAEKVVSYPISLAGVAAYLPSGERAVGEPAYTFTVQRRGTKQPQWVVAGPSGAEILHAYPNLAAAASHAGLLNVPAAALAAVGRGSLGRLKLLVVGAHLKHVAGRDLRKLGLHLPGSAYEVLAVVSLPQNAQASQLNVANFVLEQGKVVAEYGSRR